MTKLDGHVFQLLMPWMRRTCSFAVPDYWRANSRCMPSLAPQQLLLTDQFSSCSSRIARKIWRDMLRDGDVDNASKAWVQHAASLSEHATFSRFLLEPIWEKWTRKLTGLVLAEDVSLLKERLSSFVVTHVDKWPSEGIIP